MLLLCFVRLAFNSIFLAKDFILKQFIVANRLKEEFYTSKLLKSRWGIYLGCCFFMSKIYQRDTERLPSYNNIQFWHKNIELCAYLHRLLLKQQWRQVRNDTESALYTSLIYLNSWVPAYTTNWLPIYQWLERRSSFIFL